MTKIYLSYIKLNRFLFNSKRKLLKDNRKNYSKRSYHNYFLKTTPENEQTSFCFAKRLSVCIFCILTAFEVFFRFETKGQKQILNENIRATGE